MEQQQWSIQKAIELYNIEGWGQGYFSVNDRGNVVVRPRRDATVEIDLLALVHQLLEQDVHPPVLLRFSDIIGDRIEQLGRAFEQASAETGYQGEFFAVYPIKVNQQREVVEEVLRYGSKRKIGLEAGSKPELHAVLAILDDPNALVVCNGYKDHDFIELALLARKMERQVFIVIEKLNELQLIRDIAQHHQVKPQLGIRIKLSTAGSGRWAHSGGDKSKFGLNATELLQALQFAQQHGWLEHIRMIHFHLGSQITNIHTIKAALREMASFYVQLRQYGCNIEYVNVGGGLGVDYDGTHSSHPSSVNYTLQEYADDIIYTLHELCEKHQLPHPNVVTESGRAMTAHHSVLVVNVMESTTFPVWEESMTLRQEDHPLLHSLYDTYIHLEPRNIRESWHDALQLKREMLSLFTLGMLDLRTRALAESLFWSIARKVDLLSQQHPLPHWQEEFDELREELTAKYFCNFSIFQSLPDAWAIDHLFPVVPIHRLNEPPTVAAMLEDITCDSDGRLDQFIQGFRHTPYIRLHPLRRGEPYFLGIFLVGAYQEILGDLHNLFGDTNIVHIMIQDGQPVVEQILDGETVADVLEYVEFNPKALARKVERWVHQSIQAGKISEAQGREFLAIYRSGLHSYTYLQQLRMPDVPALSVDGQAHEVKSAET